MKKILLFLLFTITITFSIDAQTQKKLTKPNSLNAVNQMRDLYFKRDFEAGNELGKKLVEKYPNNLQLKTWYVMNLARSKDSEPSLDYAEKLVSDYGENIWTLLALVTAQNHNRTQSAIETGEKLVKLFPNNEEAIFGYRMALFQNGKDKEAVEWLAKNTSKIKDRSRYFVELATSTYYVEQKKEKGQIQKALDLFAQAVKLNPVSVNANYQYGIYLALAKRNDEALQFFQKAVQLSPNAAGLRKKYWSAVESQSKKTEEEKKVELSKAIDQFLVQTKNSPEALFAAWEKYMDLAGWKHENKIKEMKKRDSLEKAILQKFPNTKYDEEVAFMKIRLCYGEYFAKDESSKNLEIRLKKKSQRTPEETKFFESYKEKFKLYEAEEASLRRAYLKRPKHFDRSKLGQVYMDLFDKIASQKDSSDQEISDLIKGAIENNKNYYGNLNSDIANALLRRQIEQPNSLIAKDAEKYARLGIIEAEDKVKLLPKNATQVQIYELQAISINSLADSLIANEKLDEAEKLLTKAFQMKDESGGQNHVLVYANSHTEELWAKLYTAKRDWDKAEAFYLKTAVDDEDIIKTTFEKFYEKKTGKKDGFADYFAQIEQRLKIVAKEKVLQSRIKDAKQMIPFSLKTIDENTISSTDLKGKVIVINIWGVWCGPCVAEMPELQKVYEKYKDDKEVAILTMDSGDELAKVKKFIEEKKYTLPVLMEEDYLAKLPQFSDGSTFPTTLFIDKNGNVSFIVIGASSDLMEHFVWRIEALR